MKEDVAGRRDGVMATADLTERVQLRCGNWALPNSRSHASEPNDITHDSRTLEVTEAHRAQKKQGWTGRRTRRARRLRCPLPEFTVTTRKIAARVSCATTGCGIADGTRCSSLRHSRTVYRDASEE